jgi:GNAT superfamily N-acetyltransferase
LPVSWRIADYEDLVALRAFLTREEWRCVPFTSRWGASEFSAIFINQVSQKNAREIGEAVMLAQDGCIIPVLDRDSTSNLGYDPLFKQHLHRYRRKLHSIMGDRDSVFRIEGILDEPPYAAVDYYLMIRDFSEHPPAKPQKMPGVRMRKASVEDAPALFSLQRSYELEEVYLDPSRFDDRRCRILLRKNLKKQLIVVAEKDGIPICKAGTNARGYRIDQIGGVFTQNHARNQGIATNLMEMLLEIIARDKGGASLFVKRDNPAALKLYEKLHFTVKEPFRISYYPRV